MARTVATAALGLLAVGLLAGCTMGGPVQVLAFGLDAGSLEAQAEAGLHPDYATLWVGPWNLDDGWNDTDNTLRALRDAAIEPAIQFYYWGDDLSPQCLESGCESSLHGTWKDLDHWHELARQLGEHLGARLEGRPALVILESEFNKGSVSTYEPLDEMLESIIDEVHAGYALAQVVLAYGNWNSGGWGQWDRAAVASDFVGVQALLASTRNDTSDPGRLFNDTKQAAGTLNAWYHKPVVLQDVAVSSYPEPDLLQTQADILAPFVQRSSELGEVGVQAILYRSWRDTTMDQANYFQQAESHWGLVHEDGSPKPARDVWVNGLLAARP